MRAVPAEKGLPRSHKRLLPSRLLLLLLLRGWRSGFLEGLTVA